MESTTNNSHPRAQSVTQVLNRARRALGSRLEADLLACQATGRERSWFYAHGDDYLEPDAVALLDQLVARRLEGVPIAQLCGKREFYGRDFAVDERVLIPRPETELLVDRALALPLPGNARVCDVGTGSGCIALTLAAERRDWQVSAIDVSREAITVATENAARLGLDSIELLYGDLLAGMEDRQFDLIVSNPPYVADRDPHLDRGDARFEPPGALMGGTDGLDVIRRLVRDAYECLKPNGWLVLEHGHDQADAVRDLLRAGGFEKIESFRDLADIERVTQGVMPG